MPKLLQRLIALWLISCLTLGSSVEGLAVSLNQPREPLVASSFFIRQALSPRDVPFEHNKPLPVHLSTAGLLLEAGLLHISGGSGAEESVLFTTEKQAQEALDKDWEEFGAFPGQLRPQLVSNHPVLCEIDGMGYKLWVYKYLDSVEHRSLIDQGYGAWAGAFVALHDPSVSPEEGWIFPDSAFDPSFKSSDVGVYTNILSRNPALPIHVLSVQPAPDELRSQIRINRRIKFIEAMIRHLHSIKPMTGEDFWKSVDVASMAAPYDLDPEEVRAFLLGTGAFVEEIPERQHIAGLEPHELRATPGDLLFKAYVGKRGEYDRRLEAISVAGRAWAVHGISVAPPPPAPITVMPESEVAKTFNEWVHLWHQLRTRGGPISIHEAKVSAFLQENVPADMRESWIFREILFGFVVPEFDERKFSTKEKFLATMSAAILSLPSFVDAFLEQYPAIFKNGTWWVPKGTDSKLVASLGELVLETTDEVWETLQSQLKGKLKDYLVALLGGFYDGWHNPPKYTSPREAAIHEALAQWGIAIGEHDASHWLKDEFPITMQPLAGGPGASSKVQSEDLFKEQPGGRGQIGNDETWNYSAQWIHTAVSPDGTRFAVAAVRSDRYSFSQSGALYVVEYRRNPVTKELSNAVVVRTPKASREYLYGPRQYETFYPLFLYKPNGELIFFSDLVLIGLRDVPGTDQAASAANGYYRVYVKPTQKDNAVVNQEIVAYDGPIRSHDGWSMKFSSDLTKVLLPIKRWANNGHGSSKNILAEADFDIGKAKMSEPPNFILMAGDEIPSSAGHKFVLDADRTSQFNYAAGSHDVLIAQEGHFYKLTRTNQSNAPEDLQWTGHILSQDSRSIDPARPEESLSPRQPGDRDSAKLRGPDSTSKMRLPSESDAKRQAKPLQPTEKKVPPEVFDAIIAQVLEIKTDSTKMSDLINVALANAKFFQIITSNLIRLLGLTDSDFRRIAKDALLEIGKRLNKMPVTFSVEPGGIIESPVESILFRLMLRMIGPTQGSKIRKFSVKIFAGFIALPENERQAQAWNFIPQFLAVLSDVIVGRLLDRSPIFLGHYSKGIKDKFHELVDAEKKSRTKNASSARPKESLPSKQLGEAA